MSGRRVLVIGSGGREHALAWALARSASVRAVACAPGNPGTARLGVNRAVAADDLDGIAALVRAERYDLVVIGPEAPLAAGLADRLRRDGCAVFGPDAAGARLESSKAYAKEFMARYGIPTARFRTATSLAEGRAALADFDQGVVVKASGLAAGKGVVVASSRDEADAALVDCFGARKFGDAGRVVVLEERLAGEEVSYFAITDGTRAAVLPPSQDHKRAYDGDEGPNTGGMGAYCPASILDPATAEVVDRTILSPTVRGLREEGAAYRGLLYVGLMLTADGPRVIEYNCRFGDPETQAVLPLLADDLGELLAAAAEGRLEDSRRPSTVAAAAACVVIATASYPQGAETGLPIAGVEDAEAEGALVFHAGTAERDRALVTAGGRVFGVAGIGASLREALAVAYAGAGRIRFEGARWRTDIGARELRREESV